MALPQTFKRAVFKSAGGPLELEQVELTPPAAGELLVKVEACGVCHSDVFAQQYGLGGSFPIVPGHEVIGHVVAVGDGVKGWSVGDRAGGGWHGGHDGTCNACKHGYYQMCTNKAVNGISKNGGYAEYCLLRAESGVRVPKNIDAAKYAPILCAGVTVFNSIRRMGITPGSLVAVQGLGGLGHLAIQYANKFGYRVVALSRDASKEAFARELGAHEYVDGSKEDISEALQRLGGASLIVCTAPSAAVIKPLLNGLGILGKLLVLSVPSEEVPINISTMISNGLSVHAWPSGHATDSEEAVAFTELENVNCMIEKFPLDKAQEAYEAMLKGKVRFRAVLTFE